MLVTGALLAAVASWTVGATTTTSTPAIACGNYTIIAQGIAHNGSEVGLKTVADETECCLLCDAHSDCNAWTFHPNPTGTMAHDCWLMPEPAMRHGSDVVSGIRLAPTPPPTPFPRPTNQPPLGFKPNIVFVLTDDQDLTQDSMDAMPRTQHLFGLDGQGGCFGGGSCYNMSRAYVATPICCPSRSSYLTGKYTHNHMALQNSLGKGCASESWIANEEPHSYAAYLSTAGYRTAFWGKYLNAYGDVSPAVPRGWDAWTGLIGNSKYYDYQLSVNGSLESHGSNYATDYLTDLVANRSVAWLLQQLGDGPLACIVHTPAPHRPAQPAPKFNNTFSDRMAPRTPNWNQVGADKHHFLADLQPMNSTMIEYSDHVWRRRLRSLQSVDILVSRQFAAVDSMNQSDRTIFIYTSDHGYHSGQWAVAYCKMLPYEEDVRIPMFVRLPHMLQTGSAGRQNNGNAFVVSHPVLNIDIAPTLIELAGYSPAQQMDGTSFLSALNKTSLSTNSSWGRTFLIEYFPLVESGNDVQVTTRGTDGWCTDPDVLREDCPKLPVIVDSVNNTWACMRTITPSDNSVFCRFWDGSNFVQLNRTVQTSNFAEYYDLHKDPWQLTNLFSSLNTSETARFDSMLRNLILCGGKTCQT